MNRTFARFAVAAGALASVLLGTLAASASVIYSYTGGSYTAGPGGPPNPPFDTSMRVTASFEVPDVLAPNLMQVDLLPTVTAFQMANGVETFVAGAVQFSFLTVSTDAAGNIVEWDLAMLKNMAQDFACTANADFESLRPTITICESEMVDGALQVNASAHGANGSWSIIPEPSVAVLLAMGISLLAATQRGAPRVRRSAAAGRTARRHVNA